MTNPTNPADGDVVTAYERMPDPWEKSFYKAVGENIKKARMDKGIEQGELASALGFKNRSAMANIESGRHRILTHRIFRIAYFLQVDAADLIKVNL